MQIRSSLRDIEASLNALAVIRKLYHCGISYAVPRNTLAKANENRDWHIYAELEQVLIKKVRPLYVRDKFRLDIDNMVYAFDSSTISLCLKLCPWVKFRMVVYEDFAIGNVLFSGHLKDVRGEPIWYSFFYRDWPRGFRGYSISRRWKRATCQK